MLIVNSPSNPTGWVISEDEQRTLMAIADQHQLMVLADEVYERLIYDRRDIAPSFARVAANRDRLIVVNSFSKTYNMTGWRLGWAQASEHVITTMLQGGGVHDLQSRRSSPSRPASSRCEMAKRTFASCATISPLVATR